MTLTWRTSAQLALAAALALLTGCAGFHLPGLKPEPDSATAEKPAPAPTGVADARASYRLDVQTDDALRRLLISFLDLSRFQNAPEAEGITNAELDRLLAAAPMQVRHLIETEGYFNSETRIDKIIEPGNEIPLLLRISVKPGPRTEVDTVTIDASGELKDAIDAGDAEATATIAALRNGWSLLPADPFTQSAWNSAKTATLARLRADGYPVAAWAETSAGVEAELNLATLRLRAESGPLFRLGSIKVEGLQRYTEDAVKNLADFNPGAPYKEKLLLDYHERLQKLGLFEGAVVEIDPDPATAKAAPVTVRVKEQQQQQATVGLGFSANTGARFTLEHTNRKLFDRPYIAKTKAEYGAERKYLETEVDTYPLPNLYRNLIAGSLEQLRTADELRTSATVRIGRAQDRERLQRLYFLEAVTSRLEAPLQTNNDSAISANYHWIYRDVDNVLLPTRGITVSLQTALGNAFSTTSDSGPFARAYGRLTWYKPLGGWFATARVEAGQVFAKDSVGVPDTLLFRAGGDDSVRGYGYRSLSPVDYTVLGTVVRSGRVLFTGSAEVAHPFSARYPAFLGAVFVDAGNAADRWGGIDPVVGYGVGVRWRSPVGPLKLDLAYGEAVKQFRVHLSVGVAF